MRCDFAVKDDFVNRSTSSDSNFCQQQPRTEPFSQSQLSHSAIGRSRLWLCLPQRFLDLGISVPLHVR